MIRNAHEAAVSSALAFLERHRVIRAGVIATLSAGYLGLFWFGALLAP